MQRAMLPVAVTIRPVRVQPVTKGHKKVDDYQQITWKERLQWHIPSLSNDSNIHNSFFDRTHNILSIANTIHVDTYTTISMRWFLAVAVYRPILMGIYYRIYIWCSYLYLYIGYGAVAKRKEKSSPSCQQMRSTFGISKIQLIRSFIRNYINVWQTQWQQVR